MADDQNPQLPLGPNSDNPNGSDSTIKGPGAALLLPINIEDEMRRSYLDYSMSVIIGRALPDVRDGLKPVHRRILYGMQEMGLQYNKKYTKSAKVVGHVMGNYHPHGDSAIYDTMVRLAQPFSLRYILVDGQGNFGSIDGDPPAAMRYTESRLTRIAGEMLADIDSDTVDFAPNYDESTLEPTVLPARVPNLIVNGGGGIAVGMATNIPPHNLTEVVNACIALLNKEKGDNRPDIAIALEHVKGPDFPTGGYLYGRDGIAQTYNTGRGRFIMRSKVATENITGGRQAIIVTEIPYQVNKSNLIKRIAQLANEKIIDDISDVRDESDRDGMRIVIELKRGAEHQIVLNQLFKHTPMQESFSMIFLAVHNGQPKVLPLDHAIRYFLEHRIEVVRRRTAFLLNKARDREHLLLGFQIALDHLDNVIKIIRQSGSRAEARENLFAYFSNKRINLRGTELAGVSLDAAKYGVDLTFSTTGTLILSYRQVDAILELQLYRLTQLSIDETLKELAQVRDTIAELESILASEKKLRRVIVKELEEVRDRYGDARRTQIVDETTEIQLEDLIADEQVAVTISNTGYLKRTPISTYRQQRRGGTGRLGMKTREEDFVAQLIVDSTHAFLLCFTNTGRVFWLKIYEIPDVGAAGKGKAMASLLALQPGEKVVTILGIRDLTEEGKFIFFATRNGTVKKTPLPDFSNVMARGIIAISIDKDDELIAARTTTGDDVIFLATHEGMAIRFSEAYDADKGITGGLRPMGRSAGGNKGISLKKNDYVIGVAVTPSAEYRAKRQVELQAEGKDITPCLILSVSENGFGKRTDVEEYRLQTRGGSGVINMKTTPKIGKVSSIQLVDETSELMVISQFGKIIRIDTKGIRAAGRSTSGVKLLDLDTDDKVGAAVVIPPDESKSEPETGTLLQ
ncbi:DNA gyrase subunit A [Edaphobacter modestus]|uniref:DNA gyrase subunit A n=1 Tax=Edaphobacter modestus TaxID=388466 RepID=A0A4Q7YVT4_9BACT|nr:DNA gyrase subunit A [Edaphobacter modestus]RZU41183.1 DNA gyrase subunit A [Edaphobacter modestus]